MLLYLLYNIRIYASIVYLKHSLIDLNTVHEIETIFKHLLNGKYGELPHSNKRKSDMLIIVDFKGAGVDYNKVLELTLQIANNKMENAIFINSNSYTSLIPCMSLCCSMYASTDYQYAESPPLLTGKMCSTVMVYSSNFFPQCAHLKSVFFNISLHSALLNILRPMSLSFILPLPFFYIMFVISPMR